MNKCFQVHLQLIGLCETTSSRLFNDANKTRRNRQAHSYSNLLQRVRTAIYNIIVKFHCFDSGNHYAHLLVSWRGLHNLLVQWHSKVAVKKLRCFHFDHPHKYIVYLICEITTNFAYKNTLLLLFQQNVKQKPLQKCGHILIILSVFFNDNSSSTSV